MLFDVEAIRLDYEDDPFLTEEQVAVLRQVTDEEWETFAIGPDRTHADRWAEVMDSWRGDVIRKALGAKGVD